MIYPAHSDSPMTWPMRSSRSVSSAAVAGIVIVTLFLVCGLAVAIVLMLRHREKGGHMHLLSYNMEFGRKAVEMG